MRPSVRHFIQESERPWIVKSSGRVLGPFSTEDVAQSLREREFVALDEIVSPLGIWTYVIDEPTFAELAKQMRDTDNDEKTMTATLEASTQTEFTETVDIDPDSGIDDVTPTQNITANKYDEGETKKVKSYGFQKDINLEEEASKSSRSIYIIAIAIILVLFSIAYYPKLVTTDPASGDEYMRLGQQKYRVGEFDEAIDFFHQALSLESENTQAMSSLLPLVIQKRKDYVLARKLLEDLKLLSAQSADLFNLEGLIDLYQGKYEEALVSFKKSSALDGHYLPPMVNKMIVHYFQRDYQKVEEQFLEVEKLGKFDGNATLVSTLSRTVLYKVQKHTEFLEMALKSIDSYNNRKFEYKQELALVRTLVESLSGKQGKPAAVLDHDPYLSHLHEHDLNIYQGLMDWKNIKNICQSIVQANSNSLDMQILLSFCEIKSGEILQAQQNLKDISQKSPRSFWGSGMRAFLLTETREESKSKKILELLSKENANEFVLSVLGRNCQSLSDPCQEDTWEKLLEKNPRSVAAITGVAIAALERGETELAREYVLKGLSISPNYYPLRKLEEKVPQ